MRQVNGVWWPDKDTEAQRVVFSEVANLAHALKYIQSLRVCVQAGGHCGVWANQLAQSFVYVVTVEPDFENYKCLLRNMVPSVRPIWAALGESPKGGVGLHRRPENSGAHYVEGEGRIGVITIDELELEQCDLIVLDIEGMEPQALRGASETIAKFQPVLMVEDKGLSDKYGVKQGWSDNFPGYQVATKVARDVILVPA